VIYFFDNFSVYIFIMLFYRMIYQTHHIKKLRLNYLHLMIHHPH